MKYPQRDSNNGPRGEPGSYFMRIRMRSEFDVTSFLRSSQVSRAEGNCCELFVANLWRQHSLSIRIRRKYEPGFIERDQTLTGNCIELNENISLLSYRCHCSCTCSRCRLWSRFCQFPKLGWIVARTARPWNLARCTRCHRWSGSREIEIMK